MNQYRNPTKNRFAPKFDLRDEMLLRELIDKTPGVKNVNGDLKVLNALWTDLAIEYNKHALQYKNATTLRRKYKSIRESMKRHMKDDARSNVVDKRPKLNGGNVHQPFFKMPSDQGTSSISSSGFRYFPESESSEVNRNISEPGTSVNFGNSIHGGQLLSNQNAYGTGRPSYSSSGAINSSVDPCQSSNNNVQRDYTKDAFDESFQQDVNNYSYYDETFAEEENREGRDGDKNTKPADIDHQLAILQREKLNMEITCRQVEHEEHMVRMHKYHNLKMQELKTAMHLERSKYALEMQYFRLKIRKCKEALARDKPIGNHWQSMIKGQQQQQENMVEKKNVGDLTCEEVGNVTKEVLKDEISVLLEPTELEKEDIKAQEEANNVKTD